MIHGTLAFLSIMGVLPSSPWLHFQNEGVSLEWVNEIVEFLSVLKILSSSGLLAQYK